MEVHRLYTGDDGRSHIEKLDIPIPKQLSATQIQFRVAEVGRFQDWHPAPRRQYILNLSGAVEFGLGDGSKHVLGPGQVALADDLTGQGHTTATVGNEPWVYVLLPSSE